MDDKELYKETEKSEEKPDKATKAEYEVKYEENDNWTFDAQAPSLESEFETDPRFSEVVEPKEPEPKKSKQVESEKAVNKKKDKRNNKIFAFISVVMVAIIVALGFLGNNYYNGQNSEEVYSPGNVIMTVGDADVSVGMYNYYYTCIANQYITYGYLSDTTQDSLKETTTNDAGETVTWDEYLKELTVDHVQYVLAYYQAACDAGVTVTDEQKETIESNLSSFSESATESGFDNVDDYIASIYGYDCGYNTIKTMLYQCYTAENYYQQHVIEAKPTDDEITKYFEDNKDTDTFYQVPYAFLQISYDSTDDDDAAEAKKKAEKYASKITDVDSLKKLIPQAYKDAIESAVEAGSYEDADAAAVSIAEYAEQVMTADSTYSLGDDIDEWLASDDTKVGDCESFLSEDYACYFVILKTGEKSLRDDTVYTARHILVEPESEDEDSDDTTTTTSSDDTEYTEDEWAAAKRKAESILNEYNKTDKTEYAFAQLAEEYSDDTASTSSGGNYYGGLCSGITIGSFVSEFEDWCLDSSRKYGDVEIVKTKYGYHLIFFIEQTKEYKYLCESGVQQLNEDEFVASYKVTKHERVFKLNNKEKAKLEEEETTTSSESTTSSSSAYDDDSDDMDY